MATLININLKGFHLVNLDIVTEIRYDEELKQITLWFAACGEDANGDLVQDSITVTGDPKSLYKAMQAAITFPIPTPVATT